MTVRGFVGVFLAVALLGPVPAEAQPKLVGSFKDWFAYTTGAGANRVCYALSEPKKSEPAGAKRDPTSFLISTWPTRKTSGEPSILPGYQYKEGSKAQVQVGSDKFDFFTKNDGNDGGAWIQNPADERRLLAALKRGSSMSITGVSSRGTLTRDTYSLAGISAALDKAAATCK